MGLHFELRNRVTIVRSGGLAAQSIAIFVKGSLKVRDSLCDVEAGSSVEEME